MNKKDLRKKIIQQRDQLSPHEIDQKSSCIAKHLYSLPAFREAQVIMFFVSFGSEVATRAMVEKAIDQGKTVLAPRALPGSRSLIPSPVVDWDHDLAPGSYGILEPREDKLRPYAAEDINLLIVPGVAFDQDGNRLGYGGGYYDRFFSLLKPQAALVALAYELQVIAEVPVDRWDRPVDIIVTEKRILHVDK